METVRTLRIVYKIFVNGKKGIAISILYFGESHLYDRNPRKHKFQLNGKTTVTHVLKT